MPSPAPPSGPSAAPEQNHTPDAEERVHRLIEWLRSGQRLTTPLAAAAFTVSRRTIARDLAYIRDTLGLGVAFDHEVNSYVLPEEHTALPYLAFPTLTPVLLNAQFDAPPSEQEHQPHVWLKFSARAIQTYCARGGHIPAGATNEDGTLDVRFTPRSLDEFMSYVLSRGTAVEVLAPNDFRRRVHMEIRRMLTAYEDEPLRPA